MKFVTTYMLSATLMIMFLIILVMLSVAYLTVMERKILGYMQCRKGPDKVGVKGLLQPFSDMSKLLLKEDTIMINSNYYLYLFSPMFGLLMIMLIWLLYPIFYNHLLMNNGLIYLMCCLSISSYSMIIAGWSSNSVYSMLGAIRSLAQAISYEVVLSLFFLLMIIMTNSFNFKTLSDFQLYTWLIVYMWPLAILFLISMLAELNRIPFDFSEGESELVSGFNVEYSGGSFILIFLAEYASILVVSMLFTMMFLGGNFMSLMFYIKMTIMSFFIIWIRATLPRFRYDLLMSLCWMTILPIILNYMIILISMKF